MIFRLFLLVLLVCSGVFFFFMFTHQEEFLAFIAKTQPETTQSWNTKQVREMRSNATQKLNNLGYLHKILTEKFPEKQDKFDRFFTDTFPGAMLRRAQVLIYHEKSYQRAYDLAKLLLPENAGAYEIIGVLYLEGHVYKKDLLQAEENFSRCVNEPDGFCAKQHDYTLNAITYYAGQAYSDKTPDNDAWAVNLLERAASQKYPPAMRTLAYALRDGIGIAQNPQRAILLFSEAAELGDVPSQ
ncbi:MAG: tetratricopeptide repeat protein, partial [Pseudobdellovibrionaceae bacterium]